jgi:hypothetical protein
MEISTPVSTPIGKNQIQTESTLDGLTEEDQRFFTSIHSGLNAISEHPSAATVQAILNYSKSI